MMPEAMIIYRFYFEEIGLTDEWWKHYSALSEDQKELIKPIIFSSKFDDYENQIKDKKCLKVLSYYRVKREDAEEAMNKKND